MHASAHNVLSVFRHGGVQVVYGDNASDKIEIPDVELEYLVLNERSDLDKIFTKATRQQIIENPHTLRSK
jgi:hypothetical protein